MEAFETYKHAGATVQLFQDYDANNPFTEWDQAASLYWHGSTREAHGYGAEPIDLDRFASTAHAARYLTLMERCLVAIPFRVDNYGSSGSRAYLTDVYDERITGFVVVTQEGIDTTGAPDAEQAAREDFATFAAWVEGDVCGFVVTYGDEHDSCWGFYGPDSEKYAREEANATAEAVARDYLVNLEPPDVAQVLAHV